MTDFSGLGLIGPILKAVEAEGYTAATPIQAKSIPALLEGRDLLGIAQTGTGKTAAFSLPLLQRLDGKGKPTAGKPRALILAPTRELAVQIADCIRTYGKNLRVRHTVVFGGSPINRQIHTLKGNIDILVATPGRLMDLMNRGCVRLDEVETFILDEADRMLDMGFINDVKKIAQKLPKERQTLLFSATMPRTLNTLIGGLLNDPVHVEVAPESTTAERVDQRVLFVSKDKKQTLLRELLDNEEAAIDRVLVFTRTKHGADRVARNLERSGVSADAIHGNKAQNARQRALNSFRSGNTRVLVATDIAARGIDVDGVTHVINFDLPNDPENYVHRIGRTARAGASGMAISFCDADERAYLRDIEKAIRQSVYVDDAHPYHSAAIASSPTGKSKGDKRNGSSKKKSNNPRRFKAKGPRRPSAAAA